MLTSKERANLRAQANGLEVTLMVGKGGVSEAVLEETQRLLEAKELIKGRVLETALLTAREASDQLCRATGVPCKVIPLLELYEDLEKGLPDSDVRYQLRIGATPSLAGTLLFQILEKFRSGHEDVQIRVTVDSEPVLEQMLLQRQIDMALTEGMTDDEHFVKVPISSEPLAVLCSPDFPAAAAGEISAPDLARQPLLLKEDASMIRRLVDAAFLFYDIAVSPSWTSTSSAVLLKAAREGLGITILPRALASRDLENGSLTELSVPDFNLDCTTHVTFLQDKYQSPAFQAFMNVILFSVT